MSLASPPRIALTSALLLAACGTSSPPAPSASASAPPAPPPPAATTAKPKPTAPQAARTPVFKSSDLKYDRYEGTLVRNTCAADAECTVSGCSSEVCAAESTTTTCDVVEKPAGACGCVAGQCIWYK
jgi:eight-cysteine-cluster-containing protein